MVRRRPYSTRTLRVSQLMSSHVGSMPDHSASGWSQRCTSQRAWPEGEVVERLTPQRAQKRLSSGFCCPHWVQNTMDARLPEWRTQRARDGPLGDQPRQA